MNSESKKGFTIVEMLMVIGVLAVLMGIVTTAASAAIRQARSRRTEAVKNVIQAGIGTFRSQRDVWPPRGGQLDKWAENGIGNDQQNGVKSGRHVAFLSAEQYDDMMQELAKVSVGRAGASPMMDFTGVFVADRGAASSGKARGIEFREAVKKNKKHGSTMSLAGMAFGYQATENGTFRRFFVQYNADSDSVVVMTESDYRNWWDAANSSQGIQFPSGYYAK